MLAGTDFMTKTKFGLMAFSLLICAAAFGAVPSFDSFDPVYFSSNNFKITLRTNNLPAATNDYGRSYGGTLVLPEPFVVTATDWNPIVVSGAGTSSANGNYYQLSTNFSAGLPSAIWTNSSGSDFRILYNDPAVVPSIVASNYFAFENAAGNLLYYELVATVPFATWSVQVNGSEPVPLVGTHLPSLISASSLASGGVLTISPGIYDIGYFAWFPTNLTVVAHGAKIIGFNAVDMVHPFGSFAMYGGAISNANLVGGSGGLAGTAFQITHITNFLTLHDVEIFGPSDGLFGFFPADNTTLDILGGTVGGWWDTVVIGKVAGLTNVTGTIIGTRFWNRTNFISTSSSFINASLNRVLIAGCTMNQGIGFTSGAGVNVNDANTTNEINGCVINMQPGIAKVLRTAGRATVDGAPYNAGDYSGTINFVGHIGAVTNNGLTTLTNATLPGTPGTIAAWVNVTNNLGKVGKIPVYY